VNLAGNGARDRAHTMTSKIHVGGADHKRDDGYEYVGLLF
jgi:hypothetical protein